METQLEYIVLRCADIEASKQFYSALGLSFVREKHGDGPVHYAARVSGTVIELYPGRGSPSANVTLGLTVDRSLVSADRPFLMDPDSNAVRLNLV